MLPRLGTVLVLNQNILKGENSATSDSNINLTGKHSFVLHSLFKGKVCNPLNILYYLLLIGNPTLMTSSLSCPSK